jgi:hypothetical protein
MNKSKEDLKCENLPIYQFCNFYEKAMIKQVFAGDKDFIPRDFSIKISNLSYDNLTIFLEDIIEQNKSLNTDSSKLNSLIIDSKFDLPNLLKLIEVISLFPSINDVKFEIPLEKKLFDKLIEALNLIKKDKFFIDEELQTKNLDSQNSISFKLNFINDLEITNQNHHHNKIYETDSFAFENIASIRSQEDYPNIKKFQPLLRMEIVLDDQDKIIQPIMDPNHDKTDLYHHLPNHSDNHSIIESRGFIDQKIAKKNVADYQSPNQKILEKPNSINLSNNFASSYAELFAIKTPLSRMALIKTVCK